MSAPEFPADFLRSLEAALRFAHASGAWIIPGMPSGSEREVPSRVELRDPGFPRDDPPRVARPQPPVLTDAGRRAGESLRAIREDLGDCRRCRLSQSRTHIVFGVGNAEAELVFVGEGPGGEEDRKGEPFVGPAGRLLDRMIVALGQERKAVYIANIIKCRPPGNRDPLPDEVATCIPFLWRQIDAIKPRVICALGTHATQNLLGADAAIGSLRGRPRRARGWTVLPTYHPAYLLRAPLAKRLAWRDMKILHGLLQADD